MTIIPFTTYLEVFIGELKVYVNQYTTGKSYKQNIKNVEFQWWQIGKRFQVQPLASLIQSSMVKKKCVVIKGIIKKKSGNAD